MKVRLEINKDCKCIRSKSFPWFFSHAVAMKGETLLTADVEFCSD